MNIIATVDKKLGIGKGGNLLVSIPKVNNLLMEETLGKAVIMGRKTFEKLPGSMPLHNRVNIVLSNDEKFQPKGVKKVSSIEECLGFLKENNISYEDVFIIGGESIYKLFMPYCNLAHITFIDYEYEADKFMENLDESGDWKLVLETEEETYFDLIYSFRLYKRVGAVKNNK